MIDIKTSKTKTALFEAACHLFAQSTQSRSPSLAEIATEAGVGRATLHRHFSTRDQFLDDMAVWALKTLDKAGTNASYKAKSFEDAFWRIIEALIPHGDKYHFLIREGQTLNQPKIKKALAKSDKDMKGLITHLQELEILNPAFSPDWINSVVDSLIYAAWEHIQKGDLAPNAAGDLVKQTLINGFGLTPTTS